MIVQLIIDKSARVNCSCCCCLQCSIVIGIFRLLRIEISVTVQQIMCQMLLVLLLLLLLCCYCCAVVVVIVGLFLLLLIVVVIVVYCPVATSSVGLGGSSVNFSANGVFSSVVGGSDLSVLWCGGGGGGADSDAGADAAGADATGADA